MSDGRELIAGTVHVVSNGRSEAFEVWRDPGPRPGCSGPFRIAGLDIQDGDRLTADYDIGNSSPTRLHLFNVKVTRRGVTQFIPEIAFGADPVRGSGEEPTLFDDIE